MQTPHNAVLLAAGGSKRLGYPKQLLTIKGIPLVKYISQIVLSTKPQRFIIITGAYKYIIEKTIKNIPGTQIIYNQEWAKGLSSSINCAAHELFNTKNQTLFIAADQFRLSSMHLNRLLTQTPGDTDILTEYTSDLYGIPARITPKTLQKSSNLYGDYGFKKLIDPKTAIRIPAPELYQDLDTTTHVQNAIKSGYIDPL